MREFEEDDALTVAQLELGWSQVQMELVLVEVRIKCDVKGKKSVFQLWQLKKIEKPVHARHSLCCKEINYATNGSHAIL